MPDEQEPAFRCTHCPRLFNDRELGRQACRVCQDRATEQVQAFPLLYLRLGTALRPGSTSGSGGRVATSCGAPLPVALQPLSLRGPGGIVSILLGIEQRWRAALDWTPLPERGGYESSLAATVGVIVNNLPWACSDYPYVAPDLQLIASLHRQADAVINGVRDVRVPIGYCPAVDDESGAVCGERLKVSPWALAICCGACGGKWDRDEWFRLGAAIRGLTAPVAVA